VEIGYAGRTPEQNKWPKKAWAGFIPKPAHSHLLRNAYFFTVNFAVATALSAYAGEMAMASTVSDTVTFTAVVYLVDAAVGVLPLVV
jgi:hypothetical protein